MAKGERRRALRGRAGRMKGGRGSGRASTGQVRLWGRHAVEAALKNPDRVHQKLWATREAIDTLDGELPADFPIEYADVADLARMVAKDAPHQGLVLECAALEDIHLDEVLDSEPTRPIIVLDQVTDPHNVGAILRSAAAFGAAALVTQDRHAPPEGGVIAKSASGALETVPWVRVINLARARANCRGRILAHRPDRRGGGNAGRSAAGRPRGAGAGRGRRRDAPEYRIALRRAGQAADWRPDREPQRLERGSHRALCGRH